jgi:L-seryl-tRNA(Ser) seleniumtransferase
MVGGGSAIAHSAVSTPSPGGADAFTTALRAHNPPIVARIERDRVLLDPRTVEPTDDRLVEEALRAACAPGGSAGR